MTRIDAGSQRVMIEIDSGENLMWEWKQEKKRKLLHIPHFHHLII